MNQETIQQLSKNPQWQELQAHILKHVSALDRVADIKLADDRELAVELLARQRAAQKLALILKPFLELADSPEAVSEREGGIYHDHLIQEPIN